MKRNQKNNKNIYGIIFLIIGIIFIIIEIVPDRINQVKENEAIKEFNEKQESQAVVENKIENSIGNKNENTIKFDYVATIKIPKINLEKGIVGKESQYNNIEYGIQVLEESDMPDVENGDCILAAHSGNSNVSHFKNLDKIEINDIVQIRYKQNTYIYKVVKKYEIDKVGEVKIEKQENKKTLTLVTCKENSDKQIVVMCDLM